MKKRLSISALLSGLLAAPAVAVPPAIAPVEPGTPIVETATLEFPLEMPGDVRRQLRKVMSGKPLDAFGMQGLRKKIAGAALRRVTQIREEQTLFPVQLATPPGTTDSRTLTLVPAARLENAPFLGISTSQASPMLRTQLNLPRGTGLVVDYVDKDSPASGDAGLKIYDVLLKFEDQLLINPQQLAVLVRSKQIGETATLNVLRNGKPLTVSLKLGGRQLPPIEELSVGSTLIPVSPATGSVAGSLVFPGAPNAAVGGIAGEVRSSVSVNSDNSITRTLQDDENAITISTGKDGKSALVVKDHEGHAIYDGPFDDAGLSPELQAKVRALAAKGSDLKAAMPSASGVHMNSSINRKDEDHDITLLRTDNGRRTLTVKDVKTGKTLYDGPADSDEETKSLPAGVIEKVKALSALAK